MRSLPTGLECQKARGALLICDGREPLPLAVHSDLMSSPCKFLKLSLGSKKIKERGTTSLYIIHASAYTVFVDRDNVQ